MTTPSNDHPDSSSEQVEVITRYSGDFEEVSVDGGDTWWTKPQFKKLQSIRKNDRQELLKRIEVSIKTKEQHITLSAGSYKEEHISLVTTDNIQAIINAIRESI